MGTGWDISPRQQLQYIEKTIQTIKPKGIKLNMGRKPWRQRDLRRWCDKAQALQVVWLAAFSEFTSFKEAIRLLIITWNGNSKFKKLIRTFAGDSPKSMM